MDRNWAKVNVLYANARLLNENENLNLQKIVDGIADYFYERGFFYTVLYDINVLLLFFKVSSETRRKK